MVINFEPGPNDNIKFASFMANFLTYAANKLNFEADSDYGTITISQTGLFSTLCSLVCANGVFNFLIKNCLFDMIVA